MRGEKRQGEGEGGRGEDGESLGENICRRLRLEEVRVELVAIPDMSRSSSANRGPKCSKANTIHQTNNRDDCFAGTISGRANN